LIAPSPSATLIERFANSGADSFAEALSYFPSAAACPAGPERYLNVIRQARQAEDIPVIATLNGVTSACWIEYAHLAEKAGAHAIELNVYFIPTGIFDRSVDVQHRYIDILANGQRHRQHPVAMKLRPYFSAKRHLSPSWIVLEPNGFVLFNRFYRPDIDLVRLRLQR
jgi:dihydroorotate dehydrogenase (fumarate)